MVIKSAKAESYPWVRKVIAVLIAALGIYTEYVSIPAIWDVLQDGDLLGHISFLVVFPIPCIGFGVYCIWLAFRIWKEMSASLVRHVSGISALIVALLIGTFISYGGPITFNFSFDRVGYCLLVNYQFSA